MTAPLDEVSEALTRRDQAPADMDRLEALEQLVRQLTSRLAGWVEAQLVQAIDDRRDDMKVLRADLQVVLNEQLAGLRAETSSVLSVAAHRLEVAQEQLSERLETVAERAAEVGRLDVLEQHVARLATVTAASEALEQRVRTAVSRLTETVEARLGQAEELRQADLDAVRADVAAQMAATGDDVAALRAGADDGPARIEAFEQRVKAAMTRLTDSVEARLAEALVEREPPLAALRAEVVGRLDTMEEDRLRADENLAAQQQRSEQAASERAAATEQRVAQLGGDLTGWRAESEAVTARAEELERRVKSAVGRLAETVQSQLDAASGAQVAELAALDANVRDALTVGATELRSEIESATAAFRGRFGQVHDRIGAVEQQQRSAAEAVDALVESRLNEVVEGRRAEFEELRRQLEESLATQLRDGRNEIAVAVADAHRRFVVSVDRLEERMNKVTEQATAAWAAVAGLEATKETVASDGRRIEALEVHTRRTDARLTEVVDAKLAEVLDPRVAELERARAEMRAALDAHLAETRAEVAHALGDGRTELAGGMVRLDAARTALDEQAAAATAGLDALKASVETTVEESEARLQRTVEESEVRLRRTVEARLADIDVSAGLVAEGRAATEATVASLTRKVARTQDQVQKKLAAVVEQLDGFAQAAARDAGALAPLRSDVRMLQTQVAELTEALADLRPKRKTPAPAATTRTRKAPAAVTSARAKASPAAEPQAPARRRRSQ